jgi:hypothetical protein
VLLHAGAGQAGCGSECSEEAQVKYVNSMLYVETFAK